MTNRGDNQGGIREPMGVGVVCLLVLLGLWWAARRAPVVASRPIGKAIATPTAIPTLSYDQVLPPGEAGREIRDLLRSLPLDEARLSKRHNLLIASGEFLPTDEKTGLEERDKRLTERISLVSSPRFDAWIARGTTDDPSRTGYDFAHWNLGVILVDKKPTPKKAYFLVFTEKPVSAGHLPQPQIFIGTCLKCHSNGPRVIRPQWTARLPQLGQSDFDRMAKWNERIRRYGRIETFLPKSHQGLVSDEPWGWEPLRLAKCAGCHNDHYGARAVLRRMHGGSMLALTLSTTTPEGYFDFADAHHAAMPMGSEPLSHLEQGCLEDWISRRNGMAPRAGCTDEGGVAAADAQTYLVDATQSAVTAVAESTFGRIPIRRVFLSGSIHCNGGVTPSCSGEIRGDLRQVSTGIDMRDRHLRERYLNTGLYPFAVVSWKDFRLDHDLSEASVEVAGKSASYPIRLTCSDEGQVKRCRIDDFIVDMTRHGIAEPGFLGARVAPRVRVQGTITLAPELVTGGTIEGAPKLSLSKR